MCTLFILTDAAFAAKYFSCEADRYVGFERDPLRVGDGPRMMQSGGRTAQGNCTPKPGVCSSQTDDLFVSKMGVDAAKGYAKTLCFSGCIEFNVYYNKVRPSEDMFVYHGKYLGEPELDDVAFIDKKHGGFYRRFEDDFKDFGRVYVWVVGTCKIKYEEDE